MSCRLLLSPLGQLCWFFKNGFILLNLLPTFATISVVALPIKSNPLNGKNLVIIPMSAPAQFRFNDSAKLQEYMPRTARMQIDILNWLSLRNNFTYSFLATNDTTLEKPVSNGNKGAMSYLLDKTCDMVLSDLFMTSGRYKLMDMPYPWIQGPLKFLIPVSDARMNFAAVLKPFQLPVWIYLLASIFFVIAALELVTLWISYNKNTEDNGLTDDPVSSGSDNSYYLYVVRLLLTQGGSCASERLPLRLVVGVWCLAAFVLGQAYNSTLITYVIAPNNPPLINSVYDIINNPNLHLIVEKNMGMDVIISSSTDEDGVFRRLRDGLNTYPRSRCSPQAKCLEQVVAGGSHIFPKSIEYLLDAMYSDYKETGQCRLQIAKEGFMNFIISFAMVKGSPYTNKVTEGIIEMNAFGLIQQWVDFYQARPHHCLSQLSQKQSTNPRLSIKNLTGAFVVLLAGYVLSLIVFIAERLVFARRRLHIHIHSSSKKKSSMSNEVGLDDNQLSFFW